MIIPDHYYCLAFSHALAPSTSSVVAQAPSTTPQKARVEGSAKSSSRLLMLLPQLALLLVTARLLLPAALVPCTGAALISCGKQEHNHTRCL